MKRRPREPLRGTDFRPDSRVTIDSVRSPSPPPHSFGYPAHVAHDTITLSCPISVIMEQYFRFGVSSFRASNIWVVNALCELYTPTGTEREKNGRCIIHTSTGFYLLHAYLKVWYIFITLAMCLHTVCVFIAPNVSERMANADVPGRMSVFMPLAKMKYIHLPWSATR